MRQAKMAGEKDWIWEQLRRETKRKAEAEPENRAIYMRQFWSRGPWSVPLHFTWRTSCRARRIRERCLYNLLVDVFAEDPDMRDAIRTDIRAVKDRDPACISYSHCMLNFKGFLACQAHRVAHRLWSQGRFSLALAVQSRISEVFAMDMHPAARIGKGHGGRHRRDHHHRRQCFDSAPRHAGGTGKRGGDRHPKIGNGVLIGAGATLLGNVKIGEGAKIGAGSVVLIDVPPHTTAVGNPARLVGGKRNPTKLTETPSETMDHTSFISEWSDYVI